MNITYELTEHFNERLRQRQLTDRLEQIAAAVKHGRKIPQRTKSGEVRPNLFAHIANDLTVITAQVGSITKLLTVYETNEATV